MIRLSRMADYGIVLATYCAHDLEQNSHTARELSEHTSIPLPTVGKILKALCRSGVLVSQRGVRGGYSLARAPEEISVVDIIQALDGPIAMTDCSALQPGLCGMEEICPVRSNWQIINRTVAAALGNLTLAHMRVPFEPRSGSVP